LIVIGKTLYPRAVIISGKRVAKMNGGNIAVLMGVLIVVTGIALVGVQVMEGGGQEMKDHSFKLIGAEAGAMKFAVETGFAGIPIIAMGVLLIIAGALTTRLS
jgi:hypothetical protein